MINTTCPVEANRVSMEMSSELHRKVLVASGGFSLLGTVASFWLLWQHLSNYTHPIQQRNIVRILSFVPAYTFLAWMRYLWDPQSAAFDIISAGSGAIVVVSFFTLLLQYLGDAPAQQHAALLNVRLVQGPFPGGWWTSPTKSGVGSGFLRFMKVAILQYAICLPICTVFASPLQSVHWDCETSGLSESAHYWLSKIYWGSPILGMYCLIVFYCTIADHIKPYRALLQLLSVLATVILCFWPGKAIDTIWIELQPEMEISFATFRMAFIALWHLTAFSYNVYRAHDQGKTCRWRAVRDATGYRDFSAQMEDFRRLVTREGPEHGAIVLEDTGSEMSQHQATGRPWTDMLEKSA